MTTTSQALKSLFPTAQWGMANEDYNTLQWFDTTTTKPSKATVDAEIARLEADAPLAACKAEAKKRIAATDWSVLPDVSISNRAEFESYRAELRALIITPVENPSYPVEPQPVWI
jgi:hypothetical protein